MDRSGVVPVAATGVARDSSSFHAEGLQVGRYMGWVGSVAAKYPQVAIAVDASDCAGDLLSFAAIFPNSQQPERSQIAWLPVKVGQGCGNILKHF